MGFKVNRPRCLSQFGQNTTEHGGLNNKYLFLRVLESGSPRWRSQHTPGLVRVLFLLCPCSSPPVAQSRERNTLCPVCLFLSEHLSHHEGPLCRTCRPPRGHATWYYSTGVRLSTREFCGDTNIGAIAFLVCLPPNSCPYMQNTLIPSHDLMTSETLS